MRKFLLAMGVIFSGLIGILIGSLSYVGIQAANSADDNKQMAVQLVTSLSETWHADGRRDIFTPAALQQVESPNGRQAISVMGRLGKLIDVENLQQTGYKVSYGEATTAKITFSGVFEHGTSEVELTLRVDGSRSRIIELNLKKIRLNQTQSIRRTA